MSTFKDLFQKLLFSLAGRANIVLYKDQLYTKNPILVKNDRIRFIKRWTLLPIEINTKNLENETFYLLIIHTDNIAHFFHDVFFPFYREWRKNKKEYVYPLKAMYFKKSF